MRHIVIGLGEVGSSVKRLLAENLEDYVGGVDKSSEESGLFDYVHVCIPYYGDDFLEIVAQYKKKYLILGGITVIHSSVPVGTSEKLDAVHSPVRGVHPNIYGGLRTFVKYFGGKRAAEAARPFSRLGIRTQCLTKSDWTEALKLWDTTYYGWNIVFEKTMKRWCDERGMPFEVIYERANQDYNDGYKALGMGHVNRPVLEHMEGKIGGHCVIPNCHLLGGYVAEQILMADETF